MKRRTWSRRLLFLACLSIGPLATACEAILDFDRTPLQPVPEASAPDATPVADVGTDRGTSSGGPAETGAEAGPEPTDAGKDVDGDAP